MPGQFVSCGSSLLCMLFLQVDLALLLLLQADVFVRVVIQQG
jgi:hypothetical protein